MSKFIIFVIILLYNTFSRPGATEFTLPKPTSLILYSVPFTSQSPFNEWSDPRQQDACEEASVLMAIKWATNTEIVNAKEEILSSVTPAKDTSAEDTIKLIFNNYYHYTNVKLVENITIDNIIEALQKEQLVITPMNGQALKNPHFTGIGPERHMTLIIGYDPKTEEFITNDPGFTVGKSYRYPVKHFYEAIRDYPTGNHVPIVGIAKNAIFIAKPSLTY